jgi:hypothetical protein
MGKFKEANIYIDDVLRQNKELDIFDCTLKSSISNKLDQNKTAAFYMDKAINPLDKESFSLLNMCMKTNRI